MTARTRQAGLGRSIRSHASALQSPLVTRLTQETKCENNGTKPDEVNPKIVDGIRSFALNRRDGHEEKRRSNNAAACHDSEYRPSGSVIA